MKYQGILASSSDPSGQTLSNTVQGLVVLLSAIVPLIAMQLFHVSISASDVSTLVTESAALIGTIMAIRGLVLKIINNLGTTPVDSTQQASA